MSSNARQLAANLPREGGLSSRNMVINGAMTVAQRASSLGSLAGSINNYYTTDRFQDVVMNLGAWTSENSTDAPEGFSRSHKRTCTSGFPSPDPSTYAAVRYSLEAQDLQRLDYGTSSAKPMTLSFWVKSNKTGSGSIDITQPDNSYRMWSNSYTINTADTWEYKTLTIPADTSGLIDDDTGAGLMLLFWLNSGSTFTGGSHQTTWGANTVANRNASNLGVGGATSDYWQITGIQLEVGDTATPFEHEPYGVTLQKCQRYYQDYSTYKYTRSGTVSSSATGNRESIPSFVTTMRTAPTITITSKTDLINIASGYPTLGTITPVGAIADCAVNTGGSHHRYAIYYTCDAEL